MYPCSDYVVLHRATSTISRNFLEMGDEKTAREGSFVVVAAVARGEVERDKRTVTFYFELNIII